MMKAEIINVADLTMLAKSDTNHWVVMDSNKEGKSAAAATPMEMVLFSLGGCLSMTVKSLLEKKRLDVGKMSMTIEAEREPQPPTVFTKIHASLRFEESGVTDGDIEWAVNLARLKYCQVDVMLEKAVDIEIDWEIL